MMKAAAAVLVVLVLLSGQSVAEEMSTKTHIFGVNPLGLVFNIYSGHYGVMINDGAGELNIPFLYWSPIDEYTLFGVGVKYRFYKDRNGKGVFYGPGLRVLSFTWDYDSFDENYQSQTEEVSGVIFTPGAEIGYRWSWDNGFTLAPTIGAGFTIGEITAGDGTEAEYGSGGISWSLGIGLAYMW